MISLEPGIKAYTGWHHLVLEVAPPGIREDTGGHHLALVGSTGHHLALVGGSGHHLALVGRGRVVAAPAGHLQPLCPMLYRLNPPILHTVICK